VGDREILETYLNSGPKNTSETDSFPHGPKSLLTRVIDLINFQKHEVYNRLHKSTHPLLSTSYATDPLLCLPIGSFWEAASSSAG